MKSKFRKGMAVGLLVLAGMPMLAQNFKAGGLYYRVVGEGRTVEVTHGEGSQQLYVGTVVVPPMVLHDGVWYDVTGVGEAAFQGCTQLTEVQLPILASRIGKNAFEGSSVRVVKPIPESTWNVAQQVPATDMSMMPSERLMEQYGSYFSMNRSKMSALVWHLNTAPSTSWTIYFDALVGITDEDTPLAEYVNRKGWTFEGEDESCYEVETDKNGEPTMNTEILEDAHASNGQYLKVQKPDADHTEISILFDFLVGKHYNVYCTFAPTPNGLPSWYEVYLNAATKTGLLRRTYLQSPYIDITSLSEEAQEEIQKETKYKNGVAGCTQGTQYETLCVASDLTVDYYHPETNLQFRSFGPSAKRDKIYTRTLCFDKFEVRAFDTSEEAVADMEQWKAQMQQQ